MIEVIYARRIKNLKGNKLQLPKLKIEPTRTGTGNVMDDLSKKQAFKKFSYRGEDITKLLTLNMDEIA
jgi:hypothetical protein